MRGIRLHGFTGGYVALRVDSVTFNSRVFLSQTTPEPRTFVMFGSGLLVIIGLARRRFNR